MFDCDGELAWVVRFESLYHVHSCALVHGFNLLFLCNITIINLQILIFDFGNIIKYI